jgi:uncharacterized protein (TIRG00374 family)
MNSTDEYLMPVERQPATAPVATPGNWVSLRAVVLGLVFGTIFLVLAFRQVSWEAFFETLRTADLRIIAVGILAYIGYLVTRAARWSLLLAERTETRPFPLLLRAVTWGAGANAVIPHSGELLRAFATRQSLQISAPSILGTIAAERFYDFAAVILFSATTLIFFHEAPAILFSAILTITVMGSVVLLGITLIVRRNPLVGGILNIATKFLPARYGGAAQRQLDELSHGVRAAFTNAHLRSIAALSVLQWLLVTSCIYAAMEAFSIDVSPWVALVILPLTIAGLTLPTAPAYLGTIQVCFLGGLTPFGIANETAIAASFGYLGITTFPVIVASGIWFVGHFIVRRKPL